MSKISETFKYKCHFYTIRMNENVNENDNENDNTKTIMGVRPDKFKGAGSLA